MSALFNPLHARIRKCWVMKPLHVRLAGGGLCLRLSDVGFSAPTKMVESVRRIANVSDIPVLADADTGYGNAVNVHYTVKEYIRAGAAGLHIEDQESPKKSGTLAGHRSISGEGPSANIKPQ